MLMKGVAFLTLLPAVCQLAKCSDVDLAKRELTSTAGVTLGTSHLAVPIATSPSSSSLITSSASIEPSQTIASTRSTFITSSSLTVSPLDLPNPTSHPNVTTKTVIAPTSTKEVIAPTSTHVVTTTLPTRTHYVTKTIPSSSTSYHIPSSTTSTYSRNTYSTTTRSIPTIVKTTSTPLGTIVKTSTKSPKAPTFVTKTTVVPPSHHSAIDASKGTGTHPDPVLQTGSSAPDMGRRNPDWIMRLAALAVGITGIGNFF